MLHQTTSETFKGGLSIQGFFLALFILGIFFKYFLQLIKKIKKILGTIKFGN